MVVWKSFASEQEILNSMEYGSHPMHILQRRRATILHMYIVSFMCLLTSKELTNYLNLLRELQAGHW